jgi:hypothetical protein
MQYSHTELVKFKLLVASSTIMGDYLEGPHASEDRIGPIDDKANGEKRVRADEVVSTNGKRSKLDSEIVNGKTQPSQ